MIQASSPLLIVVGTVLGGLLTVAGTTISALLAARTARSTGQHQLDLEALKQDREDLRREADLIRDRIESAHQILSRLGMENSLTASTIGALDNMTVAEFNQRYTQNSQELHRLRMIAGLYVQDLLPVVSRISGSTNVFWGNQQSVLYNYAKGDSAGAQLFLPDVVKASGEIGEAVADAQAILEKQSSRLLPQPQDLPRLTGPK